MSKLRVFTWHIHGSYLYYLSQANLEIYIPVNREQAEGYYGRGETFPFGDNVHEVPEDEVRTMAFDCILFQTNTNFLEDQYRTLSAEQRELPKIYLEHDPPRQHPTNTKHLIDDPDMLLVHVTHFNRLMWDNNHTATKIIEHGVTVPANVSWTGEKKKGIVVINNLPSRGRLLGYDLFLDISQKIPLDLIGMGTEEKGIGEVLHPLVPEFTSHYRFFFHPIRYTSLGLAVCEAMMAGIPIVGLATTELSSVIRNGENGFISTDPGYLVDKMDLLLQDHELARRIGNAGRETAMERFNIRRFAADWEQTIGNHVSLVRRKKLHLTA
ncbi:glycosyltransferase [Pedobacter sp. HMF7056]|uniref:Glycosyltransferase n=1 Tax=Hufsiella ginkgonis TaxID=2695274 RepID=A0A7K1Y0C1_9SPHI|nr:glycosyltransferase [Hufsiella ginkgonis]